MTKKKQTEIPGAEKPADEEIEDVIREIIEFETQAQDAAEKRSQAREHLVELMEERGMKAYVYEDGALKHTYKLRELKRLNVTREKLDRDAA